MILFLYPCGEKCTLYLSFYKHFYRVFSLQISSYALYAISSVPIQGNFGDQTGLGWGSIDGGVLHSLPSVSAPPPGVLGSYSQELDAYE